MTKKINQEIQELQQGVDWFYSDDFKLEEASEKYKSLVVLAKDIQAELAEMKNEIKVISEDFSK
jgi:exonuclease VII small subunit